MRFRFVSLRPLLCSLLLVSLPLGAVAQEADTKPPLTHDVYDEWETVEERAISDDGEWVLWSAAAQGTDPTLTVTAVEGDDEHTVARGTDAQFAADSRYVVTHIPPPQDSLDAAQRDDVPEAEQPKPALGILSLADGSLTRIDRVESVTLPEEGGTWLAYRRVPAPDTTEDAEEGPDEGAPLVVRHLPTGAETTIEHTTAVQMTEDAELLAVTTALDSTAADSTGGTRLEALQLSEEGGTPARTTLYEGAAAVPQVGVDAEGPQVAFLVADSTAEARGAHTLRRWTPDMEAPRTVVASDADVLQDGWVVSEHQSPSFAADGSRLFFGTAPAPPEPQPDTLLEKEKVDVDVWHWQDPYLQPMQKERADQKEERTYTAVHDLDRNSTVQLATEAVPAVTVSQEGSGRWALGVTNTPYRQALSWDWPPAYDAYLIDTRTGERRQVLENVQAVPELSPAGEYVVWWDRSDKDWMALPTNPDVDTGSETAADARFTLSSGIPHSVYNQAHDVPYPAGPYGLAGWTEGDEQILIYDKYDVWAVDPERPDAARAVTDEQGRADSLRFRHIRLAEEREPVAWGNWPNAVYPAATVPSDDLLLSAFNTETKASGFYRDRLGSDAAPRELVMEPQQFSTPTQAEDAERLLFTRESFHTFPDLWVSDPSFDAMERMSRLNPQQDEYRWGTAELVEWTSANGEQLEGILYKPEGFDPDKTYPMMTYFYEQYSDDLHEYYAPQAGRSIINFSFYVSRGYLVFVPDVHYEEGYPGESAMQSVVPGVTNLIDEGYVDRENIGVQGHSWGGYQIAYMVTRTNLFAAAEAGAPVSNMVSAYGGIRWGSGMSRMFQYEETQSRIGGSLWDMPMRYLQNSPIFWADRIETPLLMMHNDQDTAVPWEQGIELFVALRRLNKPAWLINYNDEPHWPTTLATMKDWTRRMQQYFDHYLKDAPAPVWLEQGIPATEKGRTLGLEPVPAQP